MNLKEIDSNNSGLLFNKYMYSIQDGSELN